MRVIKKTFNDKINKFSSNILDEQSKDYYEFDNDTLDIISQSKAIKLQIKHWFDTGLRKRYFQPNFGNSLYPIIHTREVDINDNFDLDTFIDKLETDLQQIIVVNRDNSTAKIITVDNKQVLSIELKYIIKQTNLEDSITLQ